MLLEQSLQTERLNIAMLFRVNWHQKRSVFEGLMVLTDQAEPKRAREIRKMMIPMMSQQSLGAEEDACIWREYGRPRASFSGN